MSKETLGGRKLRQLRESLGLSRQELADQIPVSEKTIARIERGETERPEKETLGAILEGLNVGFSKYKEILENFGHITDTPLPSEETITWACNAFHQRLDSQPYPAYLLDCSTRLLTWNAAFASLLYRGGVIQADNRLKGISLIRALFDDNIGLAKVIDPVEPFRSGAVRMGLQRMAQYQDEPWHQELIESLLCYPGFQHLWESTQITAIPIFDGRPFNPLGLRIPPHPTPLRFYIAREYLNPDERFFVIYLTPASDAALTACEELLTGAR